MTDKFIETYRHVRVMRGEDGFHANAGCAVDFGYCDTIEEIRAEIDDHWAEGAHETPLDTPALDTSFHDHEMAVDEPERGPHGGCPDCESTGICEVHPFREKAKHTPGPWATHLGFATDGGDIEPLLIFTDDGAGNGLPIPFRDDDADAEIAQANKRLIDAAPLMLKPMMQALHVLDCIIHESGYWNGVHLPIGGEQHGNFLSVVQAASDLRNTIAKAI